MIKVLTTIFFTSFILGVLCLFIGLISNIQPNIDYYIDDYEELLIVSRHMDEVKNKEKVLRRILTMNENLELLHKEGNALEYELIQIDFGGT